MLRVLPCCFSLIIAATATSTQLLRSDISDDCAPPAIAATLPDFAQEEIAVVWKNYHPGAPCTREKKKTKDILSVLDEFNEEFSASNVKTTSTLAAKFTPPPSRPSTEPPAPTRTTRRQRSLFPPLPEDEEEYDLTDYIPDNLPPTQGKVAKTLFKVGSPAFKDYGEDILKQRRARLLRDRAEPSRAAFYDSGYRTGAGQGHGQQMPFQTLINEVGPHQSYSTVGNSYADYSAIQAADFDEDFSVQFDTPQAPFLRDVPASVRGRFAELWRNGDVPSEGLRSEMVHLLAVSLLTGPQLEAYNTWATARRRSLRARLREMQRLTPSARVVLRQLARRAAGVTTDEAAAATDGVPTPTPTVSPGLHEELNRFAHGLESRRRARVSRARLA